MISKELLNLPGADLRRSTIIGGLQTIGALAETLMLPLAIFALGRLFGLVAPAWTASFISDPLAAIIWLMVLAAVKCLCAIIANQSSIKLGDGMNAALSSDLYLSLFNPETTERDQAGKELRTPPSQSMAALSTEGVRSVSSYFTSFLPTLIQSGLMILVAALVLLPINWAAGLIVIAGMAVMPFAASMARQKNIAAQVTHLKRYERVGVRFEEALRGLGTLKVFATDGDEAKRLSEDSEGFRKATMQLLAGQLRSLVSSDAVICLAVILASLTAAFMERSSPTGLICSIAVAAVGVRLFTPERQLVYLTHSATVAMRQGKAIAAARALRAGAPNRAKDATAEDAKSADTQASDKATVPVQLTSGICVKGLSYAYPDGFKALHDLSFDLPAHGHFGLAGASGSGKSTLAGLLSGRLTGYEGSITIDGEELSSLPQDRLIALETMAAGNDHLFSGTIRTNLDPAASGYTDEQLTDALKRADLADLATARSGLDAPVEQAGANLSGGQRQRLAIARALLRRTPIYIFDEATSAVDRDHDEALASLMDELGRDHLVITITHRLAGVRQADRILMLDEGRIAQSGDFYELTIQNGLFADQWKEQNRLEGLTEEESRAVANPLSSYNLSLQVPELASQGAPAGQAPTDSRLSAASTSMDGNPSNPDGHAAAYAETAGHTGQSKRASHAGDRSQGAIGTMRRMTKLMRPLLPIELRAIICGTLRHLCAVWAIMCASAAIIGFFIGGKSLIGHWQILAVTAIVLALLRGPLAYGEQLYNHQMAFSALRDLRGRVFDAMRALAPTKLKERGRGDLVSLITDDIELLEIFYAHTLSPVAIAIITSVVNVIVLACLSPQIALAALLCYLIIGLALPLMTARTAFRSALIERNAEGDLHSMLLETLDGRRELFGLGAAARTRQRLAEATDTMLQARSDTQFNTGWNKIFTMTACLIAFSGVACLAWILVLTGHIGFIGAIVSFIGFVSSFAPVAAISNLGSGLQPTLAAARRVFSLLDERPAVVENEDGTEVERFSGIQANNLSFSYASGSGSKPVLDGVNLSIQPGSIVGIQGANGSGKSTLIDLLMRFRERTGGRLEVCDRPIEDVRTSSLRGLETLASQETFIFSVSMADNIAIARSDASREQIADAARQACLDDVIDQLPNGLDHILARNGAELSEGQKQRVALARAFLSQAPFVAMDEPTSNMDALLEGRVIEALLSSKAGKTYLIVSHRPSVLAHASQLLTLSEGQLTAVR
ncbi:ABC superfamily ATP binding cassette transporter, ABC protein [Bifidobacterium actinocoloniiforme DSM 22766]|uniref:ABC superfamily ATP binding cassette transporter, ABC protein n=1 Tax=Bifidobacterium actinocoloniiforme DSM 22766 TaxID=1437605 RepID=A0A086YWB5_9BIFI|nr:ATP-binding cassette domain-containing protein [Bifidobacterium actinocoloniiforme]AKV55773.1 hypothetical protein AB656_05885 [Bifidobacterium actinocoloniiforme DSM 22766]KFI38565.1 ABC superfamily ATP binding cassette transporter, ABC protein [Bifidobacterium actinocoloniiforme DSM 22766]